MPMNNRPVWYLQTDPKWAKLPYANKGENSTIGGSGCGPSAMAMILATWINPKITPVETCKWAKDHGYKATGNGTYQSYIVAQAKAYGLEAEKINKTSLQYLSQAQRDAYSAQAKAYVDDGNLVVALMGPGNWTKGGHYVLWYSNQGGNVYINDSASKKETRHINTYKLFTSQARYYWVVHVPKEVISMTNSEVAKLIDEKLAAYAPKSDATKVPNTWARDFWYSACEAGYFDKSAPRANLTREQLSVVLSKIPGTFEIKKCPENFDFNTWTVNPNKPAEDSAPAQPVTPVEPKYEIYTVQQGDSAWKIAKKVYGNGTLYTKLLADNGLTTKSVLHPGDQLKVYK